MAATRVKVCGLGRPADVDAAVAAGADAVGFVVDVSVDTPREIPPDCAAALADRVPPFVTTVLVTMPGDDADRAVSLAERVGVDAVQVHGDVPPETLERVGAEAGVRTLAAVDGDENAGAAAERYADSADALLVDTPTATGGGGTGRTHDWDAARDLVAAVDCPVVLAGGLTPANVADAVRTVGPFAVDVASGVEARGGVKDHDAVDQFVERARGVGSAGREVGP